MISDGLTLLSNLFASATSGKVSTGRETQTTEGAATPSSVQDSENAFAGFLLAETTPRPVALQTGSQTQGMVSSATIAAPILSGTVPSGPAPDGSSVSAAVGTSLLPTGETPAFQLNPASPSSALSVSSPETGLLTVPAQSAGETASTVLSPAPASPGAGPTLAPSSPLTFAQAAQSSQPTGLMDSSSAQTSGAASTVAVITATSGQAVTPPVQAQTAQPATPSTLATFAAALAGLDGVARPAQSSTTPAVNGQARPSTVLAKAGQTDAGSGSSNGTASSTSQSGSAHSAQSGVSIASAPVAPPAPVTGGMPLSFDAALAPVLTGAGQTADGAPETAGDDIQAQLLQTTAQRSEAAQTAPRIASVSSPHFAGQIAGQIIERFDGRSTRFEIRLDPPELGKVNIRVEVSADGKVTAVLAARDGAVVDALMRGAKTLENALMQAGLDLSEGGVRVQQEGTRSGHHAHRDGSDDAPRAGHRGLEPEATETGSALATPPERWTQRRLNLVA